MITLLNNTKSTARLGHVVALDPTNSQAFLYATPNSVKAIGVVGEASAYRKPTKVFSIGDKAQVYVQGNVRKGDVIRLSKSGDNISLGACIVAKSTDVPYFRIGEALTDGRGLIPVVLDLTYITSDGTSSQFLKLDQTTQQTTVGTLHYPTATFGGSANYSEFESDGTLKFNGDATVWNDLPPSPIVGARLGSTAPTLRTFITDIEQYTFDATNDYVIGATELTHEWKEGTVIYPHIHWATNGLEGSAKGVQWQLKYTIGDDNGAFSVQATAVIDVEIPASTADRTHFISEFAPTITGTSYGIGTYICWRLARIATAHGGGEPAAEPFALAIGFHVEQDTCGSRQRLAK